MSDSPQNSISGMAQTLAAQVPSVNVPTELQASTNGRTRARLGSRTGLGSQRYLRLFEHLLPLMGTRDPREIAMRSCELIAAMLEVQACSVFLAEPGAGALRLAAATHIPREVWDQVALPLTTGICGEVHREGKARLVRGRAQFKAQFGREPDERYGSPSCVIVALRTEAGALGVINVAHPVGRREFRPRDIEILESAAKLVACAMEAAVQFGATVEIHRRLESVFDSMIVGVLAVDAEGKLQYVNQRARLLCSLAPGAVIQRPHLSEVLPGTLYHVCRRLLQQLNPEQDSIYEQVESTLGGQTVHLGVTVNRATGLSAMLGETLIMVEDLGHGEELLRLREAENMKRNFLSIISHELRTPLAVIRGALPMINPGDGEMPSENTLRQTHRLLSKNCHRLMEVVDAILDVTEIESATLRLNTRPLVLNEIVASVIEYYTDLARERRLEWKNDLADNLPTIEADPRRLRQVFSELLGNAIKFSTPRGTVSVITRLTGPWVEIDFVNRGTPITPEVRASIFQKFYQGDQTRTRTVGGCGLGLFLVQSLVQLHGGKIELLNSEPEEPAAAGGPQNGSTEAAASPADATACRGACPAVGTTVFRVRLPAPAQPLIDAGSAI